MTAERRGPPPEGWAAFYAEHSAFLLRVAARLVGSAAVAGANAEDVLGTTMKKLVAAGLPDDANAKAYAIRALKNTALDLIKTKKHFTDEDIDLDAEVGVHSIEDAVDDAILAGDLIEALADLPDKEALAIREKVMKDRHWSEVAPLLGVTTGQGVGAIVNRGLAKLRKMPRFADEPSSVSTSPNPSTTTVLHPGATP